MNKRYVSRDIKMLCLAINVYGAWTWAQGNVLFTAAPAFAISFGCAFCSFFLIFSFHFLRRQSPHPAAACFLRE